MYNFNQEEKEIITQFMNQHKDFSETELTSAICTSYQYDRYIRSIIQNMEKAGGQPLTFTDVANEFRRVEAGFESSKPSPLIYVPHEPQCYCDVKMLVSYGHEKHCEYKNWKDFQKMENKN